MKTKHMVLLSMHILPDSKVHGANMGPIWGRQDPGGPHIGSMNFAIWAVTFSLVKFYFSAMQLVGVLTSQVIHQIPKLPMLKACFVS